MPRFVVTRGLPEPALERCAKRRRRGSARGRCAGAEELHADVAGADAVLTLLHDRVDDELLTAAGAGCAASPTSPSATTTSTSTPPPPRRNVTNTPGVLTDATADLALALMLAVTRRLGEGERLIRSGKPWAWAIGFMLGRGLRGKTLGIVGYGEIGARVAARARAFGMKVVYTKRRRRHRAGPSRARRAAGAPTSSPCTAR